MATVIDPTTGLPVEVPDTNYAALATQAQANPVTGAYGRTLAQNIPRPAAPVDTGPGALGIIGQGLGGAANAGLGAVLAPGAVLVDATRRGLTGLAGGDVNTLPGGATAVSDAAFGRLTTGLNDVSGAAQQISQGVSGAVLGALGAQRAQPAVATPAAPAATLAQPQSAATTPAPTTPVTAPSGLLTAKDLADTNAAIANTLQTYNAANAAPPAQTPTRGVYDQQTTDLAALRTRAAPTAGINFGFGVGGAPSATQYLQQMAAQDNQARLNQRLRLQDATQAAMISRINDPTVNIQDRKLLLKTLTATQTPTEQLAAQGAQGLLAAQAATAQAQAQQRAAAIAAAQAQQVELAKARLAGDVTLQAAGIKAAGQTQAAQARAAGQAGSQRLANAQAALAETQLNAVQAGVAGGQLTQPQVVEQVRSGQPSRVPLPIDPLTGVPYTQEALDLAQQAQIIAARNQLLRTQSR